MTTTGQTIPTLNGATLQSESLPSTAVKLGLRVKNELNKGNGKVEILVIEAPDGSWLVFVNNGKREVLK